MQIRVAVDAMGGDHGLSVTVPAVLAFLAQREEVTVLLVGPEVAVREAVERHRATGHARLQLVHASEVVGMDEPPASALRNKKNSSMRVAINMVKEGQADACVSAGNTGALMATSRFVLKTIPGIERPAIAKMLPTQKGLACMLDLGANVDCTPEHLLQFAVMGSVLSACVLRRPNPSVGLLNIGSEEIKGNDTVRAAAELLRQSGLNFYGNVEGNDIFSGTTDVVVADGFAGNIALKSSEGLARMVASFMKQEFQRNALSRLMGLLAYPVIQRFKARFDSRRYNGASLLGLRGIVVKSHGGADKIAFGYALEQAREEVASGVLAQIEANVAAHIRQTSEASA